MGRFYASIKIHNSTQHETLLTVSPHSSIEPHTLYPDMAIPEYVSAAMTMARERSYS